MCAVAGDVIGEDFWWKSLSAEGAGGAIFAQGGTNVTLKGLNLFQGCSSSRLGGGAVLLGNSTLSVDDSALESCSAGMQGGGCRALHLYPDGRRQQQDPIPGL